jgi:hypothetical protein
VTENLIPEIQVRMHTPNTAFESITLLHIQKAQGSNMGLKTIFVPLAQYKDSI